MSFSTSIENPKKEKHALLLLLPRIRLTGWEVYSGSIYRVPFTYGYIERVWNARTDATSLNENPTYPPGLYEWYQDFENGYLYYKNEDGFSAPLNPDDEDYPGLTVEFELNISDQAFTGPRHPLEPTSEVVDWVPALKTLSLAQSGSKDTLYGFLPVNQSQIRLLNNDGWMNPFLYDASFNQCLTKTYILANDDLEDGVNQSDVREIFRGYASGMRLENSEVSITCDDFIRFFDKEIPLRKITDTSYSSIDPDATVSGKEYYIRRVFGKVANHLPINVDYAAASVFDNRIWVTHAREMKIDGSPDTDGTVTRQTDHLAANTATRTYTTAAPQMMVGDTIVTTRGGFDKYTVITGVNNTLNYINHEAITGTPIIGDNVVRWFISSVVAFNPDTQQNYVFYSGRDYTLLEDNTNNVRGFILKDHLEDSYAGGIPTLDPATWVVSCAVYGRRSFDSYNDSSVVGSNTNYGGVTAQGSSHVYRFILESGYNQGDVSDDLFQEYQNNSYSMGFALPETIAGDRDTYKNIISKILYSDLAKISIFEESGSLKLGVIQIAPLDPFDADAVVADEQNHKGLSFEHDYTQVYSDVIVYYANQEINNPHSYYSSTSRAARDLHFVNKTYKFESVLYAPEEAADLLEKALVIFGERRGYWTTDLEIPFVSRSNLNSIYRLYRQYMPGTTYAENVLHDQGLLVTEVNKNARGVSITFEDQKGVQDNPDLW